MCVCVCSSCVGAFGFLGCAHRSVRFLMYSSVELSWRRSVRTSRVSFEALSALPATASTWSAVSLWLGGSGRDDGRV